MASAASSQIEALTGIRLPDMSALVEEAAMYTNGQTHFNGIVGSVLNAFDGVTKLVNSPEDASAKSDLDGAISGIINGYATLRSEAFLSGDESTE